MNERIEELSLQCIRYKLIAEGARSDFDYKKFAELIVRECARAIITDSRLNDVRSAANGCVRTINEHFGVEE